MKLCGVYGSSGFGREVMPLLRKQLSGQRDTELVFVDDGDGRDLINGHRCLSFDSFVAERKDECAIVIAIANSQVRSKLATKCFEANIRVVDVVADNAIIMDDVDISEGSIICPFVTITSNVKVGRHFHANIYSYVAHDCIVGDFVTLAPGVMCNGNVHIEDGAYIGAGAILRQGTPDKPLVVGAGSTVGMGAVVTRDVQAGSTVVGNPAKPLLRS